MTPCDAVLEKREVQTLQKLFSALKQPELLFFNQTSDFDSYRKADEQNHYTTKYSCY